MSNNKLMEAAADILASSKGKNGMPMEKMPGSDAVDLGGPTPQNYKSDDDSAKIDATKAAKSATAPTTKPSAASSKMEEIEYEEGVESIEEDTMTGITLGTKVKNKQGGYNQDVHHKGEKIGHIEAYKHRSGMRYGSHHHASGDATAGNRDAEESIADIRFSHAQHLKDNRVKKEEVMAEMHGDEAEDKAMMKKMKMKEKMKEDVDALFADDSTISEEFKSKVSTIFEARVEDRVSQIEEEIETRYAGMLEEAVESVKADLTEKVDDYLSYVVEQWMEENEIAIESGLRAELTEDFIGGLRNLFAEHYIDVPAEKVDLVDELAGKVEELEGKLNESIERGVSYAKALVDSRKNEIAREIGEGLTATQAEKIKTLAESVEFSTEDEYKSKLETLRENYFPSGTKKATEAQLNEQFEETEEKKVIHDPFVAAVSQAISKTKF